MGLLDFIYRLRPEDGDAAPHNEVGGGHVLSGGTIALQDAGGGVFAWRFTGGASTASGLSTTTTPSTAGTGITIAVDIRVNTYPSGSFTPFLSYSDNVSTPTTGLFVGANGPNNMRARNSGLLTTAMGAFGTARKRIVFRFLANDPGVAADAESLKAWHDTGGATDAHDYAQSSANILSAQTFAHLIANAIEGSSFDVFQWLIWPEALSDANCRALVRDGFDATLTPPPPPPSDLTGTVTTDDAAPTGTLTGGAPSVLTGTITADDAAPTGTLSSGAPPATITLANWRNAAGDALPGITVPHLLVSRRSDRQQVLSLSDQVVSSGSPPTLAITHASLEAGTWYVVSSWAADGSAMGIEQVQAA